MPSDYLPILAQILLAIGFAVAALATAWVLGKRGRRTPDKDKPYECGKDPVGPAQPRFSVKFYRVAMLFVLLDIEIVFLYPWAAAYRPALESGQGLALFVAMLAFMLPVIVGLLYEASKGALDWTRQS